MLGFGGNENGFRLLAARLPWSWFYRFVSRQPLRSVEAVCLGQAGLLSGLSGYGQTLSALFQVFQSELEFSPLPNDIWHYSGVRPANYPDFRLAGWSHLYHRQPNLFTSLYALLMQRLPLQKLQAAINRYFHIICSDYWQSHYRLNEETHKSHRICFGKARITEFLINLIIPLAHALARRNGSIGFIEYLESYYAHIRLPETYSQLKKQFPSFARNRSAMIIQGLLYARQSYCTKGACTRCPLLQKKH